MPADLKRHIENVFKSLQIETEFQIYNCKNGQMPETFQRMVHPFEYIICSKTVEIKNKIQNFIGKEIHEKDEFIFWYEGEKISLKNEISFTDELPNKIKCSLEASDLLKKETRLPIYLDALIFGKYKAIYSPDYQRFENNLDLNYFELLTYLGTYFPRSYAEAFCIFDDLFQNPGYQAKLQDLNIIKILSVGSGIGGEIIGLLTVLQKYIKDPKEIHIYAIDGNNESLLLLKSIIQDIEQYTKHHLGLTVVNQIFTDFQKLDVKNFSNQQFEFILSFKLIGELISNGKGLANYSYYDFLSKFLPMASEFGVCTLLDVTTKVKHSTYLPILLNEQANRAIKGNGAFTSLIPLPCNLYGETCNSECFQQQTFLISHSRYEFDRSKVAYRVIIRRSLFNLYFKPFETRKYIIHNEECCPYSDSSDINDSYKLPSSIEPANPDLSIPSNEKVVQPINFDARRLIEIKIVGKIDLQKFEKPKKEINITKKNYYIIDTNVFIQCPDIIAKIDESHEIILSAKVLDELDSLKVKLPANDKKNAQNALKSINQNFEKRKLSMEIADLELLPDDFTKTSPDNFILAVALKYKDENPIILTSDHGLQARAKGLKITTISLLDFLKQLKH